MFDIIATDNLGKPIEYLTQWDLNQTIYLRDLGFTKAPVVHFCNANSSFAYTVESTLSSGVLQVSVPNILLQEDLKIFAYVYKYENSNSEGTTLHLAQIPVRAKVRPQDYVFTENIDGINIVQLSADVKALQSQVKQIQTDMKNLRGDIQINQNSIDQLRSDNAQYNAAIVNIQSELEKVPTSAVLENGVLKFQTVINGVTTTLFQVTLS